jgi:hypothetical protein
LASASGVRLAASREISRIAAATSLVRHPFGSGPTGAYSNPTNRPSTGRTGPNASIKRALIGATSGGSLLPLRTRKYPNTASDTIIIRRRVTANTFRSFVSSNSLPLLVRVGRVVCWIEEILARLPLGGILMIEPIAEMHISRSDGVGIPSGMPRLGVQLLQTDADRDFPLFSRKVR